MTSDTAAYLLIFTVATVVGWWQIFDKAGRPGVAALIPIYNLYVICKVARQPGWWWVFMLIPITGPVVWVVMNIQVARAFGRSTAFGFGMALIPFVFAPILGFSGARYLGASDTAGARRDEVPDRRAVPAHAAVPPPGIATAALPPRQPAPAPAAVPAPHTAAPATPAPAPVTPGAVFPAPELATRLDRLERQLEAFQAEIAEIRTIATAVQAAPTPTTEPETPPAPPEVRVAAPAAPSLPPAAPARPAPVAEPTSTRPREAVGPTRSERATAFASAELSGGRAFAVIGGAVMLLGIIFLFILAANRGWIGPVSRVAIGGIASVAVFGASILLPVPLRAHERVVGRGGYRHRGRLRDDRRGDEHLPPHPQLGRPARGRGHRHFRRGPGSALGIADPRRAVVDRRRPGAGPRRDRARLRRPRDRVRTPRLRGGNRHCCASSLVMAACRSGSSVPRSGRRARRYSDADVVARDRGGRRHLGAPARRVDVLAGHCRGDPAGSIAGWLMLLGGACAFPGLIHLIPAETDAGVALLIAAAVYAIAALAIARIGWRDLAWTAGAVALVLAGIATTYLLSRQALTVALGIEAAGLALLAWRTRQPRYEGAGLLFLAAGVGHAFVVDAWLGNPHGDLAGASATGLLILAAAALAAGAFALDERADARQPACSPAWRPSGTGSSASRGTLRLWLWVLAVILAAFGTAAATDGRWVTIPWP